jgi:hypothetical protein
MTDNEVPGLPQASAPVADLAAAPAPITPEQPVTAGRIVAAGSLAAIVGVVLWAVIAVVTQHRIGFMAVGIGLLVGSTVRRFGQTGSQRDALLSGALAVAGCALGNLFMICGFLSKQRSLPLGTVVWALVSQPLVAIDALASTFTAFDAVFYGIAAYEGYKLVSMTTRR